MARSIQLQTCSAENSYCLYEKTQLVSSLTVSLKCSSCVTVDKYFPCQIIISLENTYFKVSI